MTEQDGRTRFPDLFSQLEPVKSNIAAAQARVKSVKGEKKKEKRDAEERRTRPNCGHINPDGVNFCQECGAKLVGSVKNICPACKTKNDLGARFCGGYGATELHLKLKGVDPMATYKAPCIHCGALCGKPLRVLSHGAGVWGGLLGGALNDLGYSMQRGGGIPSERFEGQSPEWHKEYEHAFERAQNEAQQHFHRGHACRTWACDRFQRGWGLCVSCTPRQEIYVAKARGRHAAKHRVCGGKRRRLEGKNRVQDHRLPRVLKVRRFRQVLQQLRHLHGA